MHSRSLAKFCVSVAIFQLSLVGLHALSSKPDNLCRGPIDIITKDAHFVATASPLKVETGRIRERVLENTGKSVVAKPAQPTTARISGGILGNDTFVFCITTFYWNDNATDNRVYSYSTIDGKRGSRVEALVTYYNLRYGTCEEAKKHSDGLAQIATRVNVFDNVISNPLIIPFNNGLKKIRKPGQCVKILNVFTYIWYGNFPPSGYAVYYFYRGYFTDEKTGKTYPATTIVFPLVHLNYMSLNQKRNFCACGTESTSHLVWKELDKEFSLNTFKGSFALIEGNSGNPTSNVAKQCPTPRKGVFIGKATGIDLKKPIFQDAVAKLFH